MFSENLINQIKEYFERHLNVVITSEQAEDYLNSLADLYLIFADISSSSFEEPVSRAP